MDDKPKRGHLFTMEDVRFILNHKLGFIDPMGQVRLYKTVGIYNYANTEAQREESNNTISEEK